jgi:membrane protein YqaA with SNARE-associated domain
MENSTVDSHAPTHSNENPPVDNPWLLWFVPLFLSVCGGVFGWVFGPIFFTKQPDATPELDLYSRASFTTNMYGSIACLGAGLVVGLLVRAQLKSFPKKDAIHLPGGPEH